MARILVTEQDDFQRSLFREYLVDAGHQVVEASDAGSGTSLFRNEQMDVAIISVSLPNANDLQALLDLTRHHPAVDIIAVCGGTGSVPFSACLDVVLEYGVRHVLERPVRRHDLLSAVDACLLAKAERLLSRRPPEE